MDTDRLVDSVKFLLKSVRQLSDRFVETNENLTRSFESVRGDVSGIETRLKSLEDEMLNLKDQALVEADQRRKAPELPVKEEHQERLIPALNLPHESVLDVYRNTPALLEPFARSVSVSGRTLSGSIDEIELEVFAQGTTWVVELQDGEWLLLPRPGMLERQTQVESLSRLFELSIDHPLPGRVELISPGSAVVVEHGRRWYLKDRGKIGVLTDPLQASLEGRLRRLEERIQSIDSA